MSEEGSQLYQAVDGICSGNGDCVAVLGLMYFAVTFGMYFLPAFIAWARRHRNSVAIFLLTLLLGWTGIGWIVALVWSFTANVKYPKEAT